MNVAEYHQMACLEPGHWWYQGLRDLLRRTLSRLPRSESLSVLDAGCGTGENLRLLREVLQPRYLGGFDLSPLALEYAAKKSPDADVYQSDICQPELHVETYDLILSCDVIYVPGMQRALPGLQKLVAALRPGGLFIVNLPAYEWLRSRHDAAIHTSQRFTRRQVADLLRQLDLVPEVLTYRMCALFPLVVAARLPSMFIRPCDAESARSDLTMPSPMVNTALRRLLELENAAIAGGMRWPWGSSVFAIGRRAPSHQPVETARMPGCPTTQLASSRVENA